MGTVISPWVIIACLLVQAILVVAVLTTRGRKRRAETECKRLSALAQTEGKRLNAVVSNVPGVVWETRTDPLTQHQKTVFVSPTAEQMLGYTMEEWLSTPNFCVQLVHGDDRERVKRECEEILSSKKQGVLNFRWVAKDNRTVWVMAQLGVIVDDTGKTIGCQGVTIDMTEQQLAEEAWRQSEEKNQTMLEALARNEAQLAGIIDSAMDAIISTDESQNIVLFNTAAENLFSCSPAEALGLPINRFIPERVRCVHEQYIRKLGEERGAPRVMGALEEFYGLKTSGEEFPMEASISQIEIGGKNFYTVILRDISERKASEVALRVAHEELHQLKNQLEAENIYLQQELQRDEKFGEIVGQSDAVKYVLFKITQVAPTDSTVLIAGETGTGKELVARAIHGASSRKERPLIKVNCAALSPTLIESELFGHEKGAFTGAIERKQGRFELANGGSLFLDEIGELPLELQVKLLRVIQESEFERLGGNRTIKIDVRIIAATNRNLKLEVEQGTFREDLWYRLNVYPITMPPLRQRKDDIPLLVEHFAATYARKAGKTILSVSPREMQRLQEHSWPGNIRELANVIERSVIHTQGSVLHVVDQFKSIEGQSTPTQTLEEVEREYILRTLESTGWRVEGKHGAAKVLGLNPSTLRTRMLKLGIQRRRAIYG